MIIVHISKTPLVNSPQDICKAINFYSEHSAYHLYEEDYPSHGRANIFTNGSFCIKDQSREVQKFTERLLQYANVIHIHNEISQDTASKVRSFIKKNTKIIYQTHSPYREGPLFFNRISEIESNLDRKIDKK